MLPCNALAVLNFLSNLLNQRLEDELSFEENHDFVAQPCLEYKQSLGARNIGLRQPKSMVLMPGRLEAEYSTNGFPVNARPRGALFVRLYYVYVEMVLAT